MYQCMITAEEYLYVSARVCKCVYLHLYMYQCMITAEEYLYAPARVYKCVYLHLYMYDHSRGIPIRPCSCV